MDRDAVPGGGAAGGARPVDAADAGAPSRRRRSDPFERSSDRSLFLNLDEDRRIASLSSEAAAWFGAASPEEMTGVDARTLLPFTSPVFAAIESCFAAHKPAKVRFAS